MFPFTIRVCWKGGRGAYPKLWLNAVASLACCMIYPEVERSCTSREREPRRVLNYFSFRGEIVEKTPRKKEIIKWRVPRRVVVLGLDANRREFILNAEASATVYSIFSRH